ncbi:PAP2-domain-containing protein, partial [Lojkania enalia]
PPFRVFLRDNWVDLLTLLIADIGALVLWIWVPLFTSQLFPVRQNGGVVWPEYAYPLRREYIPTWLSAVISFFVPFAVMGLASIFLIGSFYDANSAIMGLGYALSASTLFQSFMKLFIGGLRPHFLSVCDPILPSPGRGFGSLFYDRDICTGEDRHIREALMSFPSGHSSAAFAGFGFLVLWLNAKFKIFANRQTRCWQLLVFSAPILVAVCIAGSKIVDRWHHPGDIIAGGIIGSIFAVLAYRMRYRAVWDWRYNHTPLTR